MVFPLLLYCLFALLSAVGAFLAAAHHRGTRAGLLGASATLLCFAALGWWLLSLFREGGF